MYSNVKKLTSLIAHGALDSLRSRVSASSRNLNEINLYCDGFYPGSAMIWWYLVPAGFILQQNRDDVFSLCHH